MQCPVAARMVASWSKPHAKPECCLLAQVLSFFFFFFNSQINVKGATASAEVCSNPTRGQRGRAEFLQEPENIFLF